MPSVQVWLERFKSVHGDTYNYDQLVRPSGNANNPVIITCKVHGPFLQSPYNHANGHGCSKCAAIARGLKKRVSNQHRVDLILTRMPEPDKYDFTEFLASKHVGPADIPVTCRLHGRFTAHYSNLLHGKGCPACGELARGHYLKTYDIAPQIVVAQRRIAKQGPIFLAQAREVHGDLYDYSRVEYKGMRTKVDIICSKHGVFSQTPMKHVSQKQGCPGCASRISRGETEVAEYVRSLGVNVETSNRAVLRPETLPGANRRALPLELDVYIPDFKVGIEYQGRHWHADDQRNAHSLREKWELANKAGIRLIQIFDDEWLNRRSAVEGLLRSAVRQAGSMGARSLAVRSVPPAIARPFLNEHHLQGFLGAKDHYGLFKGDELFAVASFGASRFEADTIELIRYASICNISGGLSKIIEHTGLTKITSYCDMRHGTGQSYKKAGFVSAGMTPADYWWFKGEKRFARYECQKHRLKAHTDFAEFYADNKTEQQICTDAGFRKISGVGHLKFVFTR